MPMDAWLERDLPRLLPAFLPHQRWFAGKARQIRTVDLEDVVWLPASPSQVAFAIVDVCYEDAATERYGTLIRFAAAPGNLPMLGAVEGAAPAAWAVEAAGDPTAIRALLAGLLSRQPIPMLRGGRLVYGDTQASGDARLAEVLECGTVEPVGGEQSNTSVRIGQQAVFKLFRKLDTGENPDVEIGRFLTNHTTFRAMAALRGSLTYVAASGESSTAGVLQDWIESRSDGWAYIVPLLRQLRSGTTAGTLTRDLHDLGSVTADLHGALCSDAAESAFVPEPVTAADVQAWHASVMDRIARTFRLLEEQLTRLNPGARQAAEALLERRATLESAVKVPGLTGSGGFQKIRIHGDYHLGQVLRTVDGFAVIDFEGEPARPLAERRLKSAALKDVAGMIRSIDYAGAAACADETAAPDEPFARRLRQAFLDGYLTAANAHEAAFLPRDREAVDAWVGFFELEKALYEVEYEVNNRPGWAHIPLRGMLRILDSPA
jgi:trehalose synthase-fused probable maltokinase